MIDQLALYGENYEVIRNEQSGIMELISSRIAEREEKLSCRNFVSKVTGVRINSVIIDLSVASCVCFRLARMKIAFCIFIGSVLSLQLGILKGKARDVCRIIYLYLLGAHFTTRGLLYPSSIYSGRVREA